MSSPVYKTAVSVDKGHVRANNEDNIFFDGVFLTPDNRDEGIDITADTDKNLLVYAVFDGMGGAEFGEEASYIAAEVTNEYYAHIRSLNTNEIDSFVIGLIMDANKRIYNRTEEIGSGRMGATVAMVVICDGVAKVYNVGDSRVYLHRNGKLTQISLDDSFAQRLYRMGVISYEDALVHKDRNKLVQHLGIGEHELVIEPHISAPITLVDGDRLLVCSDGLTDMVTNEGIGEILSIRDVAQCTESLVCKALENGGRDNISVILIETHRDDMPAEADKYQQEVLEEKKNNFKKPVAISLIAFLLVALIALGVWGYFTFLRNDSSNNDGIGGGDSETVRITYPDPVVLEPGTNKKLNEIVQNIDDAKDFVYVSSNPETVSVGNDGVLYANKEGIATVTVTSSKNEIEIKVTVARSGESAVKKSFTEKLYESALKALEQKNQ